MGTTYLASLLAMSAPQPLAWKENWKKQQHCGKTDNTRNVTLTSVNTNLRDGVSK